MPLVNLNDVLPEALNQKIAIGAFNVVDITFLEAIVQAAEIMKTPVILNIAEPHLPFMDLDLLCPAIHAAAKRSDIPVILNLDHGLSMETVERAISAGFTSVMIDGSLLPFHENVRLTREVVKKCGPLNISVEAELGSVGGDGTGAKEAEADPSLYTDPERAGEFVSSTGVDALAVSIGNVHGRYRSKPKLDFDRLKEIRGRAKIPLVLHGGSGLAPEDFRRAISLGIAKINYFTGMSNAALKAVNDSIEPFPGYPEMLQSIKEVVRDVVIEQMRIFQNQ